MQEILNWLLEHPILTVLILLSFFEMGKPRKKETRRRIPRRTAPPPQDRSQDSGTPDSQGSSSGGEGEQDWMKALRDLVKDPERSSPPPLEAKGEGLHSEEMEIPERFREADQRVVPSDSSPLRVDIPVLQGEETLEGGEWGKDSVFSRENTAGGIPSPGNMPMPDFGDFRESKAFAGQGGDLVFDSSLDQMELASDHSSKWGRSEGVQAGGLEGVDPKILLLGQVLLGPPRGLRSYEEEASLPGMES